MKIITKNTAFLFFATVAFLIGSTAQNGFGQSSKPFFQDIQVVATDNAMPEPSPTPLVAKTGSSVAVGRKTSIAALANVDIPGYSGILIEGVNGGVVMDSNADVPLNPASNVKIATAYAVLKTFGPDYRFSTNVWTDGQVDKETGTLYGNLYVSGRDPVFHYEHAVAIANALNNLGIKSVTGDLIVTGDFVMSFSRSVVSSGNNLKKTLGYYSRSSTATRSWQGYVAFSQNYGKVNTAPSVDVAGDVYVQTVPNTARLLFTHDSAPMRAIVKLTMNFSNNFLSERLGDMLGGHYAVARIVHLNANVNPQDFYIASCSGLGQNRVTPRAMMNVLRALKEDLTRYGMTYADVMPVAGIDKGTLESRFDTDFSRGSVVGKTGTMRRTDGGVSALSGEIHTKSGKYLFVIFNQRGSVGSFRSFQNYFVSLVQGQMGGAAPMTYQHTPIEIRLATSRVNYPETIGRPRIKED